MKLKLSKVNLQADEKYLYLKRTNIKIGNTSTIPIDGIIKIVNPKTEIFKYEDEYYHVDDFLKITVYDNNSNELLLSDYDFVNFDKVEDILEYNTATVSKDIREIGCKIKRLYTDTHIEGITVPKPVEDYNDDSIAYRYYLPNNMLSGVNISLISSNEWFSIDSKTIVMLKPITKIEYLITKTNENNECQDILDKIRQIVFDKQR